MSSNNIIRVAGHLQEAKIILLEKGDNEYNDIIELLESKSNELMLDF